MASVYIITASICAVACSVLGYLKITFDFSNENYDEFYIALICVFSVNFLISFSILFFNKQKNYLIENVLLGLPCIVMIITFDIILIKISLITLDDIKYYKELKENLTEDEINIECKSNKIFIDNNLCTEISGTNDMIKYRINEGKLPCENDAKWLFSISAIDSILAVVIVVLWIVHLIQPIHIFSYNF